MAPHSPTLLKVCTMRGKHFDTSPWLLGHHRLGCLRVAAAATATPAARGWCLKPFPANYATEPHRPCICRVLSLSEVPPLQLHRQSVLFQEDIHERGTPNSTTKSTYTSRANRTIGRSEPQFRDSGLDDHVPPVRASRVPSDEQFCSRFC